MHPDAPSLPKARKPRPLPTNRGPDWPGRSCAAALLGLAMLAAPTQSGAASITVRVGGAAAIQGAVACALFREADREGFPTATGQVLQQWVTPLGGAASCRFDDVAEGLYAVSVMNDLNANRKLDTNLFGVPQEPWGVSNNPRPLLRPPRFEEAQFSLGPGQALAIDVGIAR